MTIDIFVIIFSIVFSIIHLYLFVTYRHLIIGSINRLNPKLTKNKQRLIFWLIFIATVTILIVLRANVIDKNLSLMRILNYEFGLALMLLFLSLALHLAYLFYFVITKYLLHKNSFKIKPVLNLVFVLAIVLFSIGVYNYHKPLHISKYELVSNKISKPLYIIHVTDTQYGTADSNDLKKVELAVNKLADAYPINYILFTGDIVDTGLFNLENLQPLRFDKVNAKKLFVLGNHEFYHGYPRPHQVTEQLGYQLLRKNNYQSDEFNLNIIGVDDPAFIEKKLIYKKLDLDLQGLVRPEKYNILMYHRPSGVDSAVKNGIDLMLTGHTHGGQFWPLTWIVQLINQYPLGLTKVKDMILFNSDGASLWGPRVRLGTKNEISLFVIKPESIKSK